MKKVFSLLMVIALIFSFSACSNGSDNEESPSSIAQAAEQSSEQSLQTDSKSLVVYFSWSGHTENVARSVQSQTGADIFEIVPANPYSDSYDDVVDLAKEEQQTNARPEISGNIENIEQYDVIYVGFPNWWADMPMILYTFFDTYDLAGKSIAPFCTSGGSGLSETVNEIKSLEPDAIVTEGLHISSGSSSRADDDVAEWLDDIGQGRQE